MQKEIPHNSLDMCVTLKFPPAQCSFKLDSQDVSVQRGTRSRGLEVQEDW